MENDQGSPPPLLANIFQALPPEPELVLFVWSNEAFAFALRHIRKNVHMPSEECPMQSAHGRWAITNPYGKRPLQGYSKGVAASLLGPGPHWIIINMGYYATVDTVLNLFTDAALTIKGTQTKMVSCNTPDYAIQQLRHWRGELPPTVYWLPHVAPADELPGGSLWTGLLEGTRVSLFGNPVEEDFDPDLDFLPDIMEPE